MNWLDSRGGGLEKMIQVVAEKDHLIKDYQRRLSDQTKTSDRYVKTISTLQAKNGELKGEMAALKKRRVSSQEETRDMEE